MAIVGAAALAVLGLVTVSTLNEQRIATQMSLIEKRYVPKLTFGPRLEREFDAVARGFQDAVAAQDRQALEGTHALRARFLGTLDAARGVAAPADLDRLRRAFEDYYHTAYHVSRQLIVGDTGEQLVAAIGGMQGKQVRARERLERVTSFDRGALGTAFSAAEQARATAARARTAVALAALTIVTLLSLLLSRSVLRSLAELARGFTRFGAHDFSEPIRVHTSDELGTLGRQANRMAENLRRLAEQRERSDWLREGQAGLAHELRGELDPSDLAQRTIGFLTHYLGCPAAAFYGLEADGTLRLLAHHAPALELAAAPAQRFAIGEGLVGQVARGGAIALITDLPPGYMRLRSGLGEAAPRAIALMPLVHAGRVTGVVELAVLASWTRPKQELLASVQETLAIALEVARARADTRALLAETQRQAQRLAEQEDQLRARNEELQAQQADLQRSNQELTQQSRALQSQQRALARTNAELLNARRSLEQQAKELLTISNYKSQFLANMSHELRTPLNSMLLLSNVLAQNESKNLTDKQVEYCKTINAAGKDLLALINQVLDLARVEAGKQRVYVAAVSLRELVAYAARIFGPLAREKGLEFSAELVGDGIPDTISTDRQRVEQILNNLLGNAIKFTERGRVSLRIAAPGRDAILRRPDLDPERCLALAVSDTGLGIAPEYHEAVFVPFEQIDGRPDRRYGGTGLGLTIARELTNLLGGELVLHSVQGRGSTFVCYLPFEVPAKVDAPVRKEAAASDGHSAAILAARSLAGAKVLLADDDVRTVHALSALLESRGAEVLVAETGRAAIDTLVRHPEVDLMLMDIMMPDMDGYEAIQRVRRDGRFRRLPIVALTAKAMAGDREKCLAAGATDYLPKPIEPDSLTAVLQARLAERIAIPNGATAL